MATGVNRVHLIGNLGADPELRHTQSGQTVCEFRLATNESWTDKHGEKHEKTEWHRIVVWGRIAESCNKYLAKGRTCYVEGKLQTRSWEDKEGIKRYTTEIVAQSVQFLGGGNSERRNDDQPNNRRDDYPENWQTSNHPDDDIPF